MAALERSLNRVMVEKQTTGRFNAWWPLGGVVFAFAIFVLIVAYGGDLAEIFNTFIIVPIICLTLLGAAVIKKNFRFSLLTTCFLYGLISFLVFKNFYLLSNETRWAFWAGRYKAQILAQSESRDGILRHVEWDGWGGFGAGDTVVYLAFDPSESLKEAASRKLPGKFPGLPCEVASVHRLESHWYTVMFYTNSDWEHCAN